MFRLTGMKDKMRDGKCNKERTTGNITRTKVRNSDEESVEKLRQNNDGGGPKV